MLDESHPRCSTHLTLRNIVGAFTHCADQYCECPVYRDLLKKAVSDDTPRRLLCAAS